MIDHNPNPTPREVAVFGALWLVFCGAAGLLSIWKPEALIGAATFLGLAWLVSLAANPAPRRRQLTGFVLPLAFALLAAPSSLAWPGRGAAIAAWIVGAAGAVAIWTFPAFARRLYVGWMNAAGPAGWTISQFILGIVYYVVLTPIGLLLRLFGFDPMKRSLERQAASYWIERKTESDPRSPFRQF